VAGSMVTKKKRARADTQEYSKRKKKGGTNRTADLESELKALGSNFKKKM